MASAVPLASALRAAARTASAAQSVASTRAPPSAATTLGSPRPQPSSSTRRPPSVRADTARASAIELGHTSAQYGRNSSVLEGVLVEQRLAVARAEHHEVAAPERHDVLHPVVQGTRV